MDFRLQFYQPDFEKSVIPGLWISLPCSVKSMLLMSYSIQNTYGKFLSRLFQKTGMKGAKSMMVCSSFQFLVSIRYTHLKISGKCIVYSGSA